MSINRQGHHVRQASTTRHCPLLKIWQRKSNRPRDADPAVDVKDEPTLGGGEEVGQLDASHGYHVLNKNL